jgi:RNA polymerase sigma-70 factor (ECF subfamily)
VPAMAQNGVQSVGVISPELESRMAELQAKTQEYGLGRDQFVAILNEVGAKYLAPEASERERAEFFASLRLEELALARACAAGHERAWEIFMVRYREKLYDIAAYIAKESSAARELADSIYADLYGTSAREGKRISKLASYTGRGSLEGWLRTVLAQEYVNRYRKQRRLVSLDEESEAGMQFAAAEPELAPVHDPRVEAATDQALAALSAEDRFVLASYYLDHRTLAEIARTLRVHESTISRRLDKLAKTLRKQILATLRRKGMSRRQAEEALQMDVRDVRVDIRTCLAQETSAKPFSDKKAEAQAGEG